MVRYIHTLPHFLNEGEMVTFHLSAIYQARYSRRREEEGKEIQVTALFHIFFEFKKQSFRLSDQGNTGKCDYTRKVMDKGKRKAGYAFQVFLQVALCISTCALSLRREKSSILRSH